MQAVITKVIVQQISDNQSLIELNTTLPAPFKIPGNSSAWVNVTNGDDYRIVSSNWSIVGQHECDGLAVNALCNQTIRMIVTACDLTGTYTITSIPIVLMDADETGRRYDAGNLPRLVETNITFTVDTNNFCDQEIYDLGALFDLTIVLRSDDATYTGIRGDNIFDLGNMSYWTIMIWTNSSGVGIREAQIIKLVRTSSTGCIGYPEYMNDTTNILQTFSNGVYPARIDFPLLVTNDMICSSPTTNSLNVKFNFTVRVDYIDTSRRRRRDIEFNNYAMEPELHRKGFSVSRRDSTDTLVEGGLQARVPTGDISSIQGLESSSGSSAATMLMALSIALFIMICCCSCFIFAVLALKKKRKNKNKTVDTTSSFAIMASTTPFLSTDALAVRTPDK